MTASPCIREQLLFLDFFLEASTFGARDEPDGHVADSPVQRQHESTQPDAGTLLFATNAVSVPQMDDVGRDCQLPTVGFDACNYGLQLR